MSVHAQLTKLNELRKMSNIKSLFILKKTFNEFKNIRLRMKDYIVSYKSNKE